MKISEIKKLYKKHKVPPHIEAHMKAVAKYAKKTAQQAKEKGHKINKTAIYKAALLHDLFRLEAKHEEVIANFLDKLGYKELSELVRHHGFMDVQKLKTLEQKILFYADKRVCEDQVVTLTERFTEAKIRKSIKKISKETKQAEAKIFELEKELIELLGQLPNSF